MSSSGKTSSTRDPTQPRLIFLERSAKQATEPPNPCSVSSNHPERRSACRLHALNNSAPAVRITDPFLARTNGAPLLAKLPQVSDLAVCAPAPAPIDLGCGHYFPVRWSKWCAIFRYERHVEAWKYVGNKTFPLSCIAQTESGIWEFHGKQKPATITSDLVILGDQGDAVGCRHDTSIPNTAYLAVLLPGALDESAAPLFGRQVVQGSPLPKLQRSLALATIDDFDSFIFEVFGIASRATSRSKSKSTCKVRVQRMKRFIEKHAFEPIEVSDIAESVGLSPFVCIRLFKLATGLSPHRYLSSLRFERARSLLKNTRLPIIDVAAQIGVRDRFYFTRWFSKEAGIPPHRYRLTMR